jgi:quercetin dioxygenase-like cupin family protein
MKGLRSKRLVLAGAAFGLVGMIAASVALATHVTGSQPAEVLITRTVDPDGLESGWHTHPGPVIVQVESGHFTMYQGSCAPKIIGPGETYIEVPNVPINAVSKSAITWTTTLIIPDSALPRTPADDPCG